MRKMIKSLHHNAFQVFKDHCNQIQGLKAQMINPSAQERLAVELKRLHHLLDQGTIMMIKMIKVVRPLATIL